MAAKLSSAELAEFRRLLLDREQQLTRDIGARREQANAQPFTQLAGEAGDPADASVADATADSMQAEIERNAEELRQVQDALQRLEAGTYGVCMACGQAIDQERLKARPTARYDVRHEAERERRQGQPNTPSL